MSLMIAEPMLIDLAERANQEINLPMPPQRVDSRQHQGLNLSKPPSPRSTLTTVDEHDAESKLQPPSQPWVPEGFNGTTASSPVENSQGSSWPLPLRVGTPSSLASSRGHTEDFFSVGGRGTRTTETTPMTSPTLHTTLPRSMGSPYATSPAAEFLSLMELPDSLPIEAPRIPPKAPTRTSSILSRPSSRGSTTTLVPFPMRSDTQSSRSTTYTLTPRTPTMSLFPQQSSLKKSNSLLELMQPGISTEKEVLATVDIHVDDMHYPLSQIQSPRFNFANPRPPPRPPTMDLPPLPVTASIESPSKTREADHDSIAASSQALPSREGSFNFDSESIITSKSQPISLSSEGEISQIDFISLVPVVSHTSSSLPPRVEEYVQRLLHDRDEIFNSPDLSLHISWAEDVLRYSRMVEVFLAKLKSVKGTASSTLSVPVELRNEASKIIEDLCNSQYARAMLIKARWFDMPEEEKLQLYLSALSRGQNRAAFYIGKIYEAKKDITAACEYYKKGVQEMDSACCYVSYPPTKLTPMLMVNSVSQKLI
jgi:hypothetical protein